MADACGVGARRDAAQRRTGARQGSNHPDEQRGRQRPHHRPADEHGRWQIAGIEVGHGAAAAPDGSRIYFSNEADSTLDVVDGRTLRVTNKIPLSGHPNNIAAGRDGKRVYVAIREEPGAVDVIDTLSAAAGQKHPGEGRRTQHVRDAGWPVRGGRQHRGQEPRQSSTHRPKSRVWVMDFDLGVRPMAFETNPDGSTKRIFVQLTEFNGFAVVDFATHKEVTRIELPEAWTRKDAGPRRRQCVPRHGGERRWKEARGGQSSQQRRLRVLAARPQAPGLRRRRQGARLGDAHARRQDRLRRQRRLELRVGGRSQSRSKKSLAFRSGRSRSGTSPRCCPDRSTPRHRGV